MAPIGIFDSGYGGLTVFKSIREQLPMYDYIYLGDNARAPYGNRSFETVYEYTWECVQWFFRQNCPLVILACNTASAKALRTIQQKNLPAAAPDKRVLGVIRPTAEVIGNYTKTRAVGVMGTKGTVDSRSYLLEIEKFFPDIEVFQIACPQLVPLIESNEYETEAADYFVKKYVNNLFDQSATIDTILLACTHYPLLKNKIKSHAPAGVTILAQGDIVAVSLKDYLNRHPEMETKISKTGNVQFFTTDDPKDFDGQATRFLGDTVVSHHLHL
ncbi:MAG TPA: glutamate racemase [Flavipsychrobacter sp.]|nr:glutamate racemase [Flavipsychrobacter sp.]